MRKDKYRTTTSTALQSNIFIINFVRYIEKSEFGVKKNMLNVDDILNWQFNLLMIHDVRHILLSLSLSDDVQVLSILSSFPHKN
jgi:hypothetical protein